MATQSLLNRVYRKGLSTHPWGTSRLRISVTGVVAYLHHLGASRQEVQDPVAQGGVQTQGHELVKELGGYFDVEGGVEVNEQHSYISIPDVQMG